MIKNLKRRFIMIYMVILSCFLVTILTGIYFIVYHSEVTHSEQIMQMALQNNTMLEEGDVDTFNNSLPKKVIDFSEENVTVTSAGGLYDQEEKYIGNGLDGSANSYILRSDFQNVFFDDEQEVFPQFYEDFQYGDGGEEFPNGDGDQDFGDGYQGDDQDIRSDPDRGDWYYSERTPRQEVQTTVETTPDTTMAPSTEPSTEAQYVVPNDGTTGVPNTQDTNAVEVTDTLDTTEEPSTDEPSTTTEDTTSETTSDTSETSDPETSNATTSETIVSDVPNTEKFEAQLSSTSNITEYEGNLARNTIYVKVNKDYEIQRISYQYFESGTNLSLEQSVTNIINSGDTSGKTEIDSIQFRYYVFQPDDGSGYDIVFLDRAIEITTLNRLLVIFVCIGSIGLVVLFGLSWLLASWAVTPISDAWNKQKQFIADASHELKTPLTVIATNTDVILANSDDTVQNQAKWLNYIKSETGRMSKLVADLLYIAKSDVNEVELVMNEFNLSHTTQGVCLIFESVAFENGKFLDTDIDEDVTFKGDEDRIKQLITILVDNAIVHSEGNANIMVTLKHDGKDKVKLSVSNTNGEDIPEGYEERLFERFFRVDKARNRSNGSHGLGLNIAQSIVKNHDGTISVTSTKEHLVTFTVIL